MNLAAKLALLCTSLVCSDVIGANKATDNDLFNLSIDELLSLKVDSSSVSTKSLSRAPNVVSVITAKQIKAIGATTLSDILIYLPGVQIQHRRNGRDMLWIRGIPSGRNTKTLLMIDGVPQNEAVFGGWSPDEEVRVDNIERIELIRGPGSALYGGNAYAGVVSIVTKNADGKNTLTAYAGKFATTGTDFTFSNNKNAVNYLFSGRLYDTQGYDQNFDRYGLVSDHDNNVDAFSAQLKLGNEDWQLNYRYDNYMTEYPLYGVDDYKSQRYKSNNLSGSVKHDVGNVQVKSTAYLNSVKREFDRQVYRDAPLTLFYASDSLLKSTLFGAKTYVTIKHSDTLQTGFGLFIDKWQVDNYHETVLVSNYQTDNTLLSGLKKGNDITPSAENYAMLWQQDMTFFDGNLEMILGARYDHHSTFGNKVSSRAGFTWQSDESWSAKALWGSAYRPPTFLQQYEIRSDNNVPGNPNLNPETIETAELELSYYFSNTNTISGRVFNSKLNDFIQSIDGGPYENLNEEQNIPGIEVNWQSRLPLSFSYFDKVSVSLNFTHLNTDEASVARDVVNTTFTLENESLALFIGLNAVGNRNQSDTYHNRVRNDERLQLDNTRASLVANINLVMKNVFVPNLGIGIKLNNISNEQRFNPTYAPDGYYDVKATPFYYQLSVNYAF